MRPCASRRFKQRFLVSPIWETKPWVSRIAQNTPGSELIEAPLLIVQGTDEVLIPADIQQRFAQRLCASGQQLEYREVPGAGHLAVGDAADDEVVRWLTDRLSTPPPIFAGLGPSSPRARGAGRGADPSGDHRAP